MYNQNRGNQRRGNFGSGKPSRYGREGQQQRPHRNPLPEGFSLYYIAVVCPEPIETRVKAMKDHMFREYGCIAASKSPAHLTIVPPFRAENDIEPALLDFLSAFNIGIVPFNLQLKNYGHFDNRVLYVDVVSNDDLMQLEKECMQEFSNQFQSIIFGMKPAFHPHVTIATRDIPEGKLLEAKDFFEKEHPFEDSFEVASLRLLRLVDGTWHILQ
jgi:2'-5' RNA ligase